MKKNLGKRFGVILVTLAVSVTSVNFPYVTNTTIAQAATTESTLKTWDFASGIGSWYYGGKDWEGGYSGGSNTSILADQEMLKVAVDFSNDSASSWSQLAVCDWENDGMNLEGANKVTLDFLYDESKLTNGSFTIKIYSNAGIDTYVAVDTSKATAVSGTIKKVPVSLNFDSITSTSVNDFSVCIIGNNTNYTGDLWIDNVNIIKQSESTIVETELKSWLFNDSAENWYYGAGWEYQYDGKDNSGVSYDNGMLKVNVDYRNNADSSWSQMATCIYDSNGMNLVGANKATFDFYYDTSNMTTGSFSIKLVSQAGIETFVSVDMENAQTVTGTLKKATVAIPFDELGSTAAAANDFNIEIVGNQTDYYGSVWFDNIRILNVTDSSVQDIYVNSVEKPVTGPAIQIDPATNNLITTTTTGVSETTPLSTSIKMVDKDASAAAKQIYTYLDAVGKSSSTIFGQQNNTHHKAGAADLSDSDTFDVTGSYTGIIGIDALSLTGNEYNASRYNNELGADLGATPIPETVYGNIQAAAALTNYNIQSGAIISLSAHMPNFSLVKESNNYDGNHSYTKYDFSGYSPNTLSGDVINQILPGGKYNEVYNAYLDMIADYAGMVNGAILFRPFHENTGSWFWWGAAFCDAQTYQNVYKYTVEYLRDIKDVHNLIYVYGPSSEAANTTEYGERYPGDDYVDMVGFDMYNLNPTSDDTWFTSFKNELKVVQDFASQHNKLVAVTETGVATSSPDKGDNQTALHKTGNLQKEWYEKLLPIVTESNASYFLVWANFGEKDGFYTPYVKSVSNDATLYGHEMLDNFIKFYNDSSSIFAVDQKNALTEISSLNIDATATTVNPTGYITAPVSGTRILSPVSLFARVTGANTNDVVKFILHGTVDKELTAHVGADGITYTADLDSQTLTLLGEYVGSIELTVNGNSLNKVNATFNIPVPEEDPYQIDGFENYYGVDSLLTKKWAPNKASGSTLSISLTKEKGKFRSGSYGLKFQYDETYDGWAGATISKEVSWSNCNALQFWTIPDGNNQKVVIQLTANGTVYETYLNLYDGYKDSTSPMLVTIPFNEFGKRDTTGHPKGDLVNDCSSITSFGLWVNAINGTPAVVDGRVAGTIYYDDITAVKTSLTTPTFQILNSNDGTSGGSTGGNNGETSGGTNGGTTGGTTDGSTGGTTDGSTGGTTDGKEPQIVISDCNTSVSTMDHTENKKVNTILSNVIPKDTALQYVAVNVTGSSKNDKMKVYATSLDGVKAGSKVYVYSYNKETNKVEYLNKTTYKVDKDGYITINQVRDTKYLILDQKVVGKNILSRAEQTIVKESLVVTKGKNFNLNIGIRQEYKNLATVTYKVSNKEIATVDKKGNIKALKKGEVTVTTTVNIGKVTKQFTTKVTVK